MNATAIGLTVGIALLGLLVILIGIFPSQDDPSGRPPGQIPLAAGARPPGSLLHPCPPSCRTILIVDNQIIAFLG